MWAGPSVVPSFLIREVVSTDPIGRQGRVGRGCRGSRGAGCDVGSRVLVAWWRRDVGRMRMGHVIRRTSPCSTILPAPHPGFGLTHAAIRRFHQSPLYPHPHLPTSLQILPIVCRTKFTAFTLTSKASILLPPSSSPALPSTVTLHELAIAAKQVCSCFIRITLFFLSLESFAHSVSPPSPRPSHRLTYPLSLYLRPT